MENEIQRLIEAILPELKAESEKAKDKYLVKHPEAVSYEHYKNINGNRFIFKWSKDLNVADPKWHFRIEEKNKKK